MAELRADYGIEPTLDEILWLHELGKRVENPTGERFDLAGIPAKAGNAHLWPMTIMASSWFHDRAIPWFSRSNHLLTYCLAFALAHGRGRPIPEPAGRGWFERLVRWVLDIRTTRTLDDLVDRDEAYRAIKRWAGSLHCRPGELDAAIDAVLNPAPDEEQDDDRPGVDLEELAQDMAVLTGTAPDYWRMGSGRDRTIRAYLRAVTIEKARRGENASPVRDAQGDAIADMRKAMVRIIADHRAAEEQAVTG